MTFKYILSTVPREPGKGVEMWICIFLNLWQISGSRPGRCYPGKRASVELQYVWFSELVWSCGEQNNLLILPGIKPRFFSHQPRRIATVRTVSHMSQREERWNLPMQILGPSPNGR
jgi:hypothetical protein